MRRFSEEERAVRGWVWQVLVPLVDVNLDITGRNKGASDASLEFRSIALHCFSSVEYGRVRKDQHLWVSSCGGMYESIRRLAESWKVIYSVACLLS